MRVRLQPAVPMSGRRREQGERMTTATKRAYLVKHHAWLVIARIQELSPETLRELHGAVVQEHIRRENVKAKAARRPV